MSQKNIGFTTNFPSASKVPVHIAPKAVVDAMDNSVESSEEFEPNFVNFSFSDAFPPSFDFDDAFGANFSENKTAPAAEKVQSQTVIQKKSSATSQSGSKKASKRVTSENSHKETKTSKTSNSKTV